MENDELIIHEETETAKKGDDFELKMLDCGTNYQMDAALPTCLSCFCGSGCFCGR